MENEWVRGTGRNTWRMIEWEQKGRNTKRIGFYIKNGLKFKDISPNHLFREKIFKSAIIEVQFGKTSYNL